MPPTPTTTSARPAQQQEEMARMAALGPDRPRGKKRQHARQQSAQGCAAGDGNLAQVRRRRCRRWWPAVAGSCSPARAPRLVRLRLKLSHRGRRSRRRRAR